MGQIPLESYEKNINNNFLKIRHKEVVYMYYFSIGILGVVTITIMSMVYKIMNIDYI
jgi:hypothetical protein